MNTRPKGALTPSVEAEEDMNNFYPKGALKGREQFGAILKLRRKKPFNLYLVSAIGVRYGAYKIYLGPDTVITMKHKSEWNIINPKSSSHFILKIDSITGYLQSVLSSGYIFDNYWHAYAHILYLEQSGFPVELFFK